MTKTQSIKETLDETNTLYRFGNQWRFNYYDSKMKGWRQSYPTDYWSACLNRKVHMIEITRTKLGIEDDHFIEPGDYSGGSWKSFI